MRDDVVDTITALRADNERLRALSTELYEALDACVTWLPSGFAPQSQSSALAKANKAMANYSDCPFFG